jgi:zinc protease
VEPGDAIERTHSYFASIGQGAAAAARQPSIEKLAAGDRLTRARATANRVYLVWNVPQFDSREDAGLALLVEILAGGINSRLSRQLIQAGGHASEVGGELRTRELGSQMVLWATAHETTTCAELEPELRAELHQFRKDGPTDVEVQAARERHFARLIRSSEHLCGPHGKADRLATAAILAGDAHAHERRLARTASIPPEELSVLARAWLDDAAFVLEFSTVDAAAQRSPREARSHSRLAEWPHANSMRKTHGELRAAPSIIAIQRSGSGLYEFRLIAEGGCGRDPAGKSGLAGVAIAAITAGDPNHGGWTAAQFDRIGAEIEARVRLDASIFRMSALAAKMPQALKLYARMICDPQIDEVRLNDAIAARSALIRHERSHPIDLARRILPPLVFPPSHPYARPLSGSGTLAGVASVGLQDVHRYQSSWHSRGATTLIICGPSPESELRAFAQEALAGLVATESPTTPDWVPFAGDLCTDRIVLVDQPNRLQTAIFAAFPTPPRSALTADALLVADFILGGSFTSRLNLKLRESKGWSYGARTALLNARHASLWLAHTFVQPANTIAAMRGSERELRAPLVGALVTPEELTAATACLTLRLPSELETNRQVADAMEDRIVCRLPPTYYEELPARLRTLRPAEVTAAWHEVVSQHPITWLVVGDAALLAGRIEAEGFGLLEVIGSPDEVP